MPDLDKHVRRSQDDYAAALADLLPRGRSWPRDPTSVLMMLVRGLAGPWGQDVDPRAGDLLEIESDPRLTVEMLPDWERAFGLPDKCLAEPLTIADRRVALLNRMTTEGGQSRAFFIALAASIGYTINIIEYSPFMGGVSRGGDTRPTGTAGEEFRWYGGPPEMRFYWKIKIMNARLSWFRGGQGEGGVDPHLRIGLATDLECVLRRLKPAHTDVIFDYSGLVTGGEFAGTP
jgi:uncharacterized protein YmfQ (DUF2313 family)